MGAATSSAPQHAANNPLDSLSPNSQLLIKQLTSSLRSTGLLKDGQELSGDAPFPALNMARELAGAKNLELQNYLAPMEHQAFARNVTAENPFAGIMGLPIATLGYGAGKATGLINARSDPGIVPDLKSVLSGVVSALAGFKAQGE